MDTRKAAEGIVLLSRQDRYQKATLFLDAVEAVLRELVEEARDEASEAKFDAVIKAGYAEGFSTAKEKAQQIALANSSGNPDSQADSASIVIAARIGNMKMEAE